MKTKTAFLITTVISAILIILLSSCSFEPAKTLPPMFEDSLPVSEADESVHLRVAACDDPHIVYAPIEGRAGYRYGPSMIYYADGSCDAWFSCNGSNGEWDWISYKHSDDGINFGDEKIVLTPTPDSKDLYSCCDPGVVYFGGYYYLGYTSTTYAYHGGVNNNVFVARSVYPDGPYEKWDGKGWGGDPEPIVYYNEDETKYGAGEPSFVVLGDSLYVYYTWACSHGQYLGIAVADAREENWPLTLKDHGPVLAKSNCDSVDMMYLEDNNKFYGFCTSDRFSENSGITVYESSDGIHFHFVEVFKNRLYRYLHNGGVAHRPDGHVQLKDRHFVGYAFSNGADGNWGQWATAFQQVDFELYSGKIEEPDESEKGDLKDGYFALPLDDPKPIAVLPSSKCYTMLQHYSGESIAVVWVDGDISWHAIDDPQNIQFYGYDEDLIYFEDNYMFLKGNTGTTIVYIKYKGLTSFFKVRIYPTGDSLPGDYKKEILSFEPVQESFSVNVSDVHKYQIRGFVRFSDHTWAEAFNDGLMIDSKAYPVTFEVKDSDIISVSSKGFINPKAPGKTEVKVTIKGEKSFVVNVEVKDE